jgi:hypothetical protein
MADFQMISYATVAALRRRLPGPAAIGSGLEGYPVQYESMKADRPRQSTARSSAAGTLATVLALVTGALLRIWMLRKFFEVSGDARLYGGMAKNLLLHGQYALTDQSGVVHSTLIRLPGYPLFLAACFRLFGMENYWAASMVQIFLEVLGCILLGSAARRISPPAYRTAAAQATLWLACLCPFTAVYDAMPLTEGLSIFCLTVALWATARFQDEPGWGTALMFTIGVTFSALLRPDGALVGVALAPPVLLRLFSSPQTSSSPSSRLFSVPRVGKHELRLALACLFLALAPFAAWTWRNWQVFHVIEPLAPRYATDPGEDTWPGWQRWMKTWSLDFISTFQVYWNVPGGTFDLSVLPPRAFDSPAQRAETARLASDYEQNGEELSPELDLRFAELARQRIAAHPLRYYAILPLGRVADMWLRPRVENLNIDLDWWVYRHHYVETRFSWFYAGVNALYVVLAVAGLCLRPRLWLWMLAYLLLRSALLATIEAPEARYTLECFPILFVLAGIGIGRLHASASRVGRFASTRIG